MNRKRMIAYLLLSLGLFSCTQIHSEDDELRTVPVTNNPNLVPKYGTGFPMGAA